MNKVEFEKTSELILYSLMRSADYFSKYGSLIKESDFLYGQESQVFKAITNSRKFNIGIDSISPEMVQQQSNQRDQSMNRIFASNLVSRPRPLASQEDFEKFKTFIKNEQLAKLAQNILKQGATGMAPNELIKFINDQILIVQDGEKILDTAVYNAEESVEMTLTKLDEWENARILGTGIPETDAQLFLNRLPRGFIVIGGRSGAGKTTKLCSIILYRVREGEPGIIFSLEMSVEQLYMKMALSDPILNNEPLTNTSLRNKDFNKRLRQAITNLRKLKLYVKASDNNIHRISETTRQYSIDYDVRTAGLDYIQLGSDGDPKSTEVTNVNTCSRVCQALSKPDSAKNYPALSVIATSQYTEGTLPAGTNPLTTKPNNQMFRWGKQLWHDADLIIHMYQKEQSNSVTGTRKILMFCGKQREGMPEWETEEEFLLNQQTFTSEGKRKAERQKKEQRVNEITVERGIKF